MPLSSLMKMSVTLTTLGLLYSSSAYSGTEIKLNSGTISTVSRKMNLPDLTQNPNIIQEWMIQFVNPILETDKKFMKTLGIKIFSYLPEDTLIVKASANQLSHLLKLSQRAAEAAKVSGRSRDPQSLGPIQSLLPFEAFMKVPVRLAQVPKANAYVRETYIVSLFESSDRQALQEQIDVLNKNAQGDQNILVQKIQGRSAVITMNRSQVLSIAKITGVESVQEFVVMHPLSFSLDMQDVPQDISVAASGDYSDINGYETGTRVMHFEEFWNAGITGQNQIVGMADTGLDSGDSKNIHSDFQNAVISGYAVGMFGKTWADSMGHGTHVAGSVLGRGAASKGLLKGGAYSAQMVAQGMWSPILNNLSVPSNLVGMFNQAYADGARIHTNSWGGAANFGAYDKMAASVDEVMFDKQDILILFAAGNSGVDKNKDGRIDPNSIGTPGTSKNALTVGASENLEFDGGIQKKVGELKTSPENWPSAPITESKLSDNINGIAMFSSRGPTTDGRLKPEIVAPGTNILSVRSQQKGAEPLWGLYNNDYAWSGGTSMATPLTAGAAALVRQFLIEKMNLTKPSAAIVKAMLMHTAFEMYPGQYGELGAGRGQELLTLRPNNDEGYGRVDLAQVLKFSQGVNLFLDSPGVSTGEIKESTLKSTQAGVLQVNLVWTDAPGSTSASKALVNDLDLEVVLPDGRVIARNDQINNHSFINVATSAGEIKIRVKGVNVPMGKNGLQPFAVIASVQ